MSALCGALADQAVEVKLCTADDHKIAGASVEPPSSVPVYRYGLGKSWLEQHVWRGELSSVFTRAAESCAVIHSHGMWTRESYVASRVSARAGLPHVISCRGMLEPWALGNRRVKKWIALAAYQRRILETASILHATSSAEARSIRRFGLWNPIAVVPNGVNLAVQSRQASRAEVDSRWPQLKPYRVLLFQSRLHRVKGLDELLDVWAKISQSLPDWALVLAGNDEQRYVDRYGLSDRLDPLARRIYLGHVSNALGQSLLGAASLVVLPSHTENFGNVVAESFAHGTPVLTTENTPWHRINELNIGRCIPGDAGNLAEALQLLCGLSDATLLAMGAEGRRWMEREFSWSRVASEMCTVYDWVLGLGPQPQCVDTGNDRGLQKVLSSAA